jgi:D-alanyl-D-alanine carboxypeptidase
MIETEPMQRTGQYLRLLLALPLMALIVATAAAPQARAAPYAAMVIDARDGKVLHARNADTRLHPASLTKMMTLYVVFEAVQNGELTMDTRVRISGKAAGEPPSKLGLRAGQSIELRYLVRAAAVKSANDAATAIAEAVGGSEAAFARRMNRTAKALGMSRTTFKNAHGLTETGHLSTARDMTTMGRALFYHYPQYYNLFSRQATDAGVREVSHTNRRFLSSYRGADGIKTGYTRAAGFNLVASADRNGERIIATVFGGRSTATRNARVAELLDLGFNRASRRVATAAPARPAYRGNDTVPDSTTPETTLVAKSIRPAPRPVKAPPAEVLLAMEEGISQAVTQVAALEAVDPQPPVEDAGASLSVTVRDASEAPLEPAPRPDQPDQIAVAEVSEIAPAQDVASIAVLTLAQAPEALNLRPSARPSGGAPAPEAEIVMAEAEPEAEPEAKLQPAPVMLAAAETPRPARRPALGETAFAQGTGGDGPVQQTRLVTRVSTSGGRLWRVSLGSYPTRFAAEQALLESAMREMTVLDGALRKVVQGNRGFEARFLGLTEAQANRTCTRVQARGAACEIGRAG